MKVYLDVCCLNRPFDDPAGSRVAMEAAAVIRLFREIEAGRMIDFSSEMASIEINQTPDENHRRRVRYFLPPPERIIAVDAAIAETAARLVSVGFKQFDAVHLSAAANLGVDVFVTVDDRLLKRARNETQLLRFRVLNPVALVQEIDDDQ